MLDRLGRRSVYSLSMRLLTRASALILGCSLLAGCDSADNPLAPPGTVLTITASPSQISLSGQGATITVIGIRPDGNPIAAGTLITLATNLGVLRPATASCTDSATVGVIEADGQGRAAALLCGDGRTGEAMVTATLTSGGGGGGEGGGGGTSAMATVQIGQPETSRPTVLISANPSTVAVGAESVITLIGRGADNSPVPSGSRIRLTADLGTLRCGRFPCPGESSNPCNAACTNAQGEAEAIFTAGDRSGDAQITAILGTGEPAMATIDINAAIDSLDLVANPSAIDRLDAGVEITLTATVLDPLGTPLSSLLVRFSSEVGDFDGGSSANSNPQGIATVTLVVDSTDVDDIPPGGTFEVTATATSEGETRTGTDEITVR